MDTKKFGYQNMEKIITFLIILALGCSLTTGCETFKKWFGGEEKEEEKFEPGTSNTQGLCVDGVLQVDAHVTCVICDSDGYLVRTLLDANKKKGDKIESIQWDGKDDNGKDVESGDYTWYLIFDDGKGNRQIITRTLTIVR